MLFSAFFIEFSSGSVAAFFAAAAAIFRLKPRPDVSHFLDFRPNVGFIERIDLSQNADLLRDGQIETVVDERVDFLGIVRQQRCVRASMQLQRFKKMPKRLKTTKRLSSLKRVL